MRFSDFCQYFSANFRHKHCAALHLVWSDLFYKRNIRNIAGVNDSGNRTPCGGDVTFGVYRRCSSAEESNHIPKANTFCGRGGIRLIVTRGYLRYENMIDYVCFLH